MKKAKLMLGLLTIIVVAGSGLAFIATNRYDTHIIYTGVLHSGSCPDKTVGAAIASGQPNVAASTTVITNGSCPDNLTVAVDN